MTQFTHLHVHSHFSILDGMSKVSDLVDKCRANGMNAMALTDHGNMFGIKELTDYAGKVNGASKKKLKDLEKSFKDETDEEKKAALGKDIEALKAKMEKEIPFKPIIGIEAYCARRTLYDKDKDVKVINPETGREQRVDASGWHLILLAKNKEGYKNLCKLSSIAYTDGYYDRPRIDKNLLQQYHEGLIVCSACLGGEIPQLIIAGKLDEAEASVRWFKDLFGDDYYIELQRHETNKPNAETGTFLRQQEVIPHLVEIAKKTNTKIIATNDVHFVEEDHGEAHDRLICLSTGKELNDPNRMHYTKQEWLKTPDEMAAIFPDYPEALANTMEIADKVEVYSIESGPIMPKFEIPESFGTEAEYRQRLTDKDLFDEFTQDEKGNVVMSQEDAETKIKKIGGYEKLYRIKLEADYLAKLTWEGARERYGEELTEEQRERIVFELHIMKTMGFPGYFLIVSDYIRAAREELKMYVGPGRGSAAGSVVAYCLKITDLDPLKYDLLFERFLNPDRISLPDIDVDFEDTGKILEWVTEKYGKEKVARIITYGTMATKSSIADVSRVQGIPLPKVAQLKSYVPDKFDDFVDPDTGKTFAEEKKKAPKVKLKNCLKLVKEMIEEYNSDDENVSSMLKYASQLEDTNRQIGIHACGVIIGADDLTKFAPMCTVKDRETGRDVLVTQYDGHVIESVGLIKMDFLGLQTLAIMKNCVENIKHAKGEDLDIFTIPIDDEATYRLFSEGRTIAVFQFESPGMQKYLRELGPTCIQDLIAMNALYRPGPMEYIPKFISRKHGDEKVVYDLPIMEKYLNDTYGVTVYQEQVMLLSRLLAGFTRGQSDALRKAMGKKIFAMLAELKPKFIEGGLKNPHIRDGMAENISDKQLESTLEKIWKDWEAFASYAFNKSHAACYAWVAYQTGYLKAHYPAEFMAANLTTSKDNIKDVTKLMDECKSMGLNVKGPDVNESELNFAVNKSGAVLFGLGGVKGVGDAAVEAILRERNKNGEFKSVFDFVERVNLSACNRKTIESLALAGAFDSLKDVSREQFMAVNTKGEQISEVLVRYGNKVQSDKATASNSLWGALDEAIEIKKPEIPKVESWSVLERLNRERELVGIYLSAHPLDEFSIILKHVCNTSMADFATPASLVGREISSGGMVTGCKNGTTKKGNPYSIVTIEDFSGAHEFPLFGNDFVEHGSRLQNGFFVYFTGSYQPRKFNPQEVEFRFGRIELLPNVKDTLVEKLTLEISEEKVDANFVSDFVTLVKDNPGKVNLYVKVREQESGLNVDLFSRSVKVDVSTEIVNYLQSKVEDETLTFKIN